MEGRSKQCLVPVSSHLVTSCLPGEIFTRQCAVRLLLEAGANKNLADSHSEVMQVEVARLLLECCEWKDGQTSAACSVSSHVVTSCLPGEIFARHCALNAHIRISRFLVRTSFEDHIKIPPSQIRDPNRQ